MLASRVTLPKETATRHERQPRPAAVPAGLTPEAVRALQRTAGNASVGRLLARSQDETAVPVATPPPAPSAPVSYTHLTLPTILRV